MTRPIYPSDLTYSEPARRARRTRELENAVSIWAGTDELHPAIRAAMGRLLFHQGAVPQSGADTIESIAWHRESGARPGWLNRTERRNKRKKEATT